MAMLMFYGGVGFLAALGLGLAGMPPHRAFYLGMAWPAFFYALAHRAAKAKFLADVEVWAGISPIRQEIQLELAVTYAPAKSDDIPG